MNISSVPKKTGILRWERDFVSAVLRIAIPVALQSLVASLMHILDGVMVGRLGESSIAAVTQANRVTFLFQLTIFGLTGAVSTFCSQYWGTRNMAGIYRTQGLALGVCLLVAAIFIVPCLVAPESVMRLFLHEEEAIRLSVRYLRIICFTYLVQGASLVLSTVQKSTEQVKLSMFASILAIGINTVLNYGLIFGRLGMPEMGVEGAAIATLIAVVAELGIIWGLGHAMRMSTRASLRDMIPREKQHIKRFFAIALPIVGNELFWSLGITMYSVVYGHMGTETVAAMSICGTVEQLSFILIRAITSACAILIGKAIGMGDEAAAKLYSKRFMVAAVALGQVAGLIMIALSGPIIGLYEVSDAVKQAAQAIILIRGFTIVLSALGNIFIVGAFRAGGDAVFSFIVDAGCVWVVGLPLIWLTGIVLGWPIQWVYIMTVAEQAVKVLLCGIRFKSGKWINNLVKDG